MILCLLSQIEQFEPHFPSNKNELFTPRYIEFLYKPSQVFPSARTCWLGPVRKPYLPVGENAEYDSA